MKLYNIIVDGNIHLAADAGFGLVDATAAGFSGTMESLISGEGMEQLEKAVQELFDTETSASGTLVTNARQAEATAA